MKKTNVIIKLIAAALVVCLALTMLVSCSEGEAVMTYEKDGKTYSISEKEYELILKIKKLDYACNMLLRRQDDTASFWASTYDEEEGTTYADVYGDLVLEQTKAILVEKYLFDSLGLEISQDKLDGFKSNIKTQEENYGGKGTYKQYFGYTASDYYNIYMQMVTRSEMVLEHLYGENGANKVTDEDLSTYYTDNYVGYQFIMLDMENKVVRDEEGNRVVATEEDDEGNETPATYYETEALSDEEKSEKQILADTILAELENGASFEDMIALYSDEYYSVEFPEGQFVLADGTFIDSTVTEAVKDLEIGEYTTEAISVSSDKYQYIVKRVELKENAYNDDKYLELFEGYEDTVMYEKYEAYIETFFEGVVVNEAVASEYSIVDTFLSEYADDYYTQYLYYYYGISQ